MLINELKARVADDAYVVDPQRVAEAVLRRAALACRQAVVVSPHRARGRAGARPARRPRS
jgi:Anti-sigma-28 factor, FlgM